VVAAVLHNPFAQQAGTFTSAPQIGVLWSEFVPSVAVSFTDVAMRSMNHLVNTVLTVRTPGKVLGPVIGLHTVKVTTLLAR
jgi:hypothetical protein